MRLLLLGSGVFGLPTFKALADEHEVVRIITSPDKPAGRKRTATSTPVGAWGCEEGITTCKTSDVNSTKMIEAIDALSIDAMVVIAFGQKIHADLIGKRLAVNLHASLLPRWRGASPINASILHGDKLAGVSVITLAERMDAGYILGQQSTPITPSETAGELHDRLALLGPNLMLQVLSGDYSRKQQDDSQVTYAPKLSRSDAILDLSKSAQSISRKICGLSPWPGCHLGIAGIDCKLLRAVSNNSRGKVGVILADGTIAVGDGSIEIVELQPAGGKPMSWRDFCNGRSIQTGDICEVPS